MADYLEEINTALSVRDKYAYYESMEEVIDQLENQAEVHKDRALKYNTAAASLVGSGIFAELYPNISKSIANNYPGLSGNEVAHIALVGGSVLAVLPAWRAHKHKNKYDEIQNIVYDLENDEINTDNTDLAYEIVDLF